MLGGTANFATAGCAKDTDAGLRQRRAEAEDVGEQLLAGGVEFPQHSKPGSASNSLHPTLSDEFTLSYLASSRDKFWKSFTAFCCDSALL